MISIGMIAWTAWNLFLAAIPVWLGWSLVAAIEENRARPSRVRSAAIGLGAVAWLAELDRDVLGDILGRRRPSAGALDEALTTLAAAAVTLRARVAPRVPAWALIGQITRGRLLARPAPVAPD